MRTFTDIWIIGHWFFAALGVSHVIRDPLSGIPAQDGKHQVTALPNTVIVHWFYVDNLWTHVFEPAYTAAQSCVFLCDTASDLTIDVDREVVWVAA